MNDKGKADKRCLVKGRSGRRQPIGLPPGF